ncbi:MAG: DUF4115 domain-containing protein [Proteobacteria bacterium]|nr:DUF4115 domain-containing protein [Pseudomonadota bacterium]
MAKITRLTLNRDGGLERRRLHLREISDDADAPLETVGQDLRAARQRKGEDLASVSAILKIRKDHLEALEECNLEALPGRTYAIGFVRSYSEYLGLNPVHFVERFKLEIAGRDEPEEIAPAIDPVLERRLPQGTIVLVALLVMAVAYGGYYLSISADRMLAQPVAPVPDRLSVETAGVAAASTVPTEFGATGQGPAAQDVAAPQAPTQTIAAPTQAAETVAPPAATGATGTDEAQVAALPLGRAYGTRNVNSRITLRMHDPARVLVQGSDDTVFLNRTLRPGDLYQAPNIVGMTLSTANSGAVEIILDGASLGFIGSTGVVAEGLSLNPQDLVDRLNQSRPG